MENREGERSAEAPIPDGERWLELLGYGHLKGQPTGFYLVEGDRKPYTAEELAGQGLHGVSVPAEEFDKLCGEWARPVLIGLENTDPNDPNYHPKVQLLQKKFDKYFKNKQEDS